MSRQCKFALDSIDKFGQISFLLFYTKMNVFTLLFSLIYQSSTYDHSLPTSNEDFPYHQFRPRQSQGGRHPYDMTVDSSYPTFPSRRAPGHAGHERIRIPSNPSVISSGKISTTSSTDGGNSLCRPLGMHI